MIDEEKNIGVPILRLPADLTTEIFTQVIQLDIDTLPDDTEDHILPLTPLDLGAVCRSWRSFVWETPLFWAVIVLKLRDEQCNNQIDILDLWLQNSGTYPLAIWFDPRLSQSNNFDDLFFHINDHSDNEHLDYGPSVVALRKLVDQSRRWKKFSTHVIYDQEFIDVLGQVKGSVPLLQSVCLNLQYDHTYGTKMDIFENAPLLKGFTVINLVSQLHDRVILPWRQLTSFHGSYVDEEGCVEVLSLCTNLIECVLSDVISLTNEFESGRIISLPHLRSLSIKKPNAGGIGSILRCMRCPELRRLHLSEGTRELPIMEIEDFICQSNCNLKTLHLENLSKLSVVLPFIEILDSLQSLVVQCRSCYHARRGGRTGTWSSEYFICNHDETDPFFNSLLTKLNLTIQPTATSAFLPNLTELQCKIPLPHFHSPSPHSTSLYLLSVLQQRWNPPEGVARLQEVVLEDTLMLDESEDENVMDGLRELMRKGMKIIAPGV